MKLWKKSRPRVFRRSVLFEQLEDRIVLDAAVTPMPPNVILDAPEPLQNTQTENQQNIADAGSQPAVAPLPTPPNTESQVFQGDLNVVLVSSDLGAIPEINDAAGQNSRLITYDADTDNLITIIDELREVKEDTGQKIDNLIVIGHGAENALRLGNQRIDISNVGNFNSELSSLGQALSENAQIQLFTCSLAKDSSGKAFVDTFAAMTGTDVFASDDDTGSAKGDWTLEYSSKQGLELNSIFDVQYWTSLDTNLSYVPQITLNGSAVGTQNGIVELGSMISVSDQDPNDILTLTLTASQGFSTLHVNTQGNVTVSGNDSGKLVIEGLQTDVNETLKHLTGALIHDWDSSDGSQATVLLDVSDSQGHDDGASAAVLTATISNGTQTADQADRVLVISTDILSYEQLLHATSDGVITVTYDPSHDTLNSIIARIETTLSGKTVDSIGLVTHDNGDGAFSLTKNVSVTSSSVSNDPDLQQFWSVVGAFVKQDGRIDIMACDVASNPEGLDLVTKLEQLTDRNVAASIDDTGNTILGGNWSLETDNVCLISTYFDLQTIQYFNGVLSAPVITLGTGDLDTSFNGTGKVTTNFGTTATIETADPVAIDANGKILVAGTSNNDFAVARYNYDGTLDTTFSEDGKVTTNFGYTDKAYSMSIDANGKIVLAGISNGNFAVARYNYDGTLDNTFSEDGMVTTDFGHTEYDATLTIGADGKIVVAGHSNYQYFSVARYNYDGSLDTTFSSDGKVTTYIGGTVGIYQVAIDADGKIVIVGASNQNFAVARYNSNGDLDTTFSGDGKLTTDFGGADYGYAVAIANNKIVVAGYAGGNFGVARYNSNGDLDTTFSGDGKLTTDFGYEDAAASVVIDSDGKIVVSGHNSRDFAIARYNDDGSLDTSFSSDGMMTIDFGYTEYGQSLAIDANGRIVVGGYGNNDFEVARILGVSTTYCENSTPAIIDNSINVSSDSGFIESATVSISNYKSAQDVLTVGASLPSNVSSSWDSVNGILTITTTSGLSSVSDYTSYLQSVRYSNTSDSPDTQQRQITWSVFDGVANSVSRTSYVDVQSVNDVPNALTLSSNSVNENLPSGTTVGTFSTTDPDTGNTFTYSLVSGDGSEDNASFAIEGSTLKTAASFNHENKSSYAIRVRTADAGGLYYDQQFTISVSNVNETPTALTLSGSSVNENLASGTAVGTFSTTDPDAGNTFTYSLVSGTGDTNNSSFTIIGNALKTTSSFNYEAKSSYSIRVRTTDAAGLFYENTHTISVSDVNETPTTLTLSSASVNENMVSGTTVGTFSTTDPDNVDTFTYTLVSGTGDTNNSAFTIEGSTLKTAASFNYENRSSYAIRVRTTDAGGLFHDQDFIISVLNVNELPSASAPAATTTLNEDGSTTITVYGADVDNPAVSDVSFSITSNVANGTLVEGDTSLISPDNYSKVYTYTPNANFNGNDGFAFTFNSKSETSDSTDTTAAVSVAINVNAVNDSPTAQSFSVNGLEDIVTPVVGWKMNDIEDGDNTPPSSVIITSLPTHGTLLMDTGQYVAVGEVSSTAHNASSMGLGDLNGDGSLDLVVGDPGQTSKVYLNRGNGVFSLNGSLGSVVYNTRTVALGDINGDGSIDAVLGNDYQSMIIFLNDGYGVFAYAGSIGTDEYPTPAIKLGDVNYDGHPDLVAVKFGLGTEVYTNDGHGTFSYTGIMGSGTNWTHDIALGDVNGDSYLDVIEGNWNHTNKIYLNDKMGNFNFFCDITSDADATGSISVGDVNNDGHLDVVSGNWCGGYKLYLNNGDGTFRLGQAGERMATNAVQMGDVNKDGYLDIVEANWDQPSKLYPNLGVVDGSWQGFGTGSAIGDGTDLGQALQLGDLDNGGYLDVIVGNHVQTVKVYENSSSITLNQEIDSSDLDIVKFVPDSDWNGTTTFSYKAVDSNAGTSVVAANVSIIIDTVNDAPKGQNDKLTILEDTTYLLKVSDFGFSDPNDDPANRFTSLTITELPALGSLKLNGIAVNENDSISVSDITSGLLAYTPALNTNGDPYADLSFVVMDDGGTLNGGVNSDVATKTMTFEVTAVNDTPTSLALGNSSVDENLPLGTTVGTFISTDPDSGDTFAYSLVSGDGAADNGSFTIEGSTLKTSASFNYENKSSYAIRVRTTDAGGLYYDQQFTISVGNVNETPTALTLTGSSVNENLASGTTVGTLSTTDPDAGNTFTYSLVTGDGSTDNTSFTIDGSTLKTSASFNYENKSSCAIRVRTTDAGGLYYENTFTVAVTDVNEGPIVTLNHGAGSLDSTFGNNGKVMTDFAGSNDQVNAATIQSDGKIVLAGYSHDGAVSTFALARYNTSGDLDTRFGNDGKITLSLSGYGASYAGSVAIQSDGRIVVAGITSNLDSTEDFVTVGRFNTSGDIDTSFGDDGFVFTNIGGSRDVRDVHMVIQGDDKIVVTGSVYKGSFSIGSGTWASDYDFLLVRYNSHGSLDTSFDNDGIVTTDHPGSADYAFSSVIQSDGKIVLVGKTYSSSDGGDIAVARYNSNGSLDSSFGGEGLVSLDIGGMDNYALSVAVQSDEKIVVAGGGGVNGKMALVRYNTDGAMDTGFGYNGIVSSDNNIPGSAQSVLVQPDGKILVSGPSTSRSISSITDFGLARYNSDGSLDLGFGSNGMLTTDIGGLHDVPNATILQTDNKIVASGYSYNVSNKDFVLVRYDASHFDYTENAGLQVIDSAITLSDPDGSNIGAASVRISGNYQSVEDMLSVDSEYLPDDVTSHWDATTGSLTISGESTITNYNSILQHVTFINTSDDPNTDARSITWSVTDSGMLSSVAQTGTITVTSLNDAPSSADSTVTTTEDTRYVFSSSDFAFADVDTGNTLQKIQVTQLESAGALKLKGADVTLDQEIALSDIDDSKLTFDPNPNANGAGYSNFQFKVSDGTAYSAASYTATMNVTAVNDTPTTLTLDNSSVSENIASGTTVGTFSTTDPDTGNTFTYSLVSGTGDADNSSFTIDGSTLKTGTSFNFEDNSSYAIRVRTADAAGSYYENTFTITVTDVNETPTALTLTGSSVNENLASGTTVGTFSTTDPDNGDTFTCTLVSGTGDTDNSSFTIEGSTLKTAASFNYETQSSYSIRVRTTDSGGLFYDNTFTITVSDVNEAPISTDSTLTATEDTQYVFSFSDFAFADVDTGNTLQKIQVTQLESAGALKLKGADVTLDQEIALSDIDDGKLTFDPNPNANGAGYSNFQFKVSDGTAHSAASYSATINVTAVNDTPTSEDSTLTATEDTQYVFSSSDFAFADVDAGNTLQKIHVTQLETAGALKLKGADVTMDQEIALSDIDDGMLTFDPDPNANGAGYSNFQFKVSDGTAYSAASYTATINVYDVAEPPENYRMWVAPNSHLGVMDVFSGKHGNDVYDVPVFGTSELWMTSDMSPADAPFLTISYNGTNTVFAPHGSGPGSDNGPGNFYGPTANAQEQTQSEQMSFGKTFVEQRQSTDQTRSDDQQTGAQNNVSDTAEPPKQNAPDGGAYVEQVTGDSPGGPLSGPFKILAGNSSEGVFTYGPNTLVSLNSEPGGTEGVQTVSEVLNINPSLKMSKGSISNYLNQIAKWIAPSQ